MPRRPAQSWSIDKHIPVALIFAIAVQTGGALWWAAKVDSRISVLENNTTANNQLMERVTKVEEKVISVKEGINRIEQTLQERRR